MLAVGIVVIACWRLYTVNNDFSIYFHPDELSKARQVIGGDRNFNHPLLFIDATAAAARVLGARDDVSIVRVGRGVSASFAAIAVGALVAWAWCTCRGGWFGAALVGISAALCPMLLVNAHYAKEETALVMGLCLVVAAFPIAWRAPAGAARAGALALMGVCAGIAISAKYVGALALIPALIAVGRTPRQGVRRLVMDAASCLLPALAAALLLQPQLLSDARNAELLADGVTREALHAVNEHYGHRLAVPSWYFAGAVLDQTHWAVLALFGVFVVLVVSDARRRVARADDVCALAITLGYLLVLSFSAIPVTRYVLAPVVLTHAMAAMGAARIVRTVPGRPATVVAGLLLTACLAFPAVRCCASFTRQFADDSRDRLAAWIAENLPPDAVVLQDQRIMLDRWRAPAPNGSALTQRIDSGQFASDVCSLDQAAAAGVTHVAICDIIYPRHFDRQLEYSEASRDRMLAAREFYSRLLSGEHELVWASVPDEPTRSFTNPEVRLYRLTPAPPPTPPLPPAQVGPHATMVTAEITRDPANLESQHAGGHDVVEPDVGEPAQGRDPGPGRRAPKAQRER
jgi:4-amino-4-deoxy-L-arabinose transferase-like glycosyltransferase